MSKITIRTNNGQVIALESADPAAGVPDVTDGAGANLLKLQEDAKKEPTDPQAEFDAAEPATESKTETDDKPEEAGKKANEALSNFIGGLTAAQKKQLASILSRESCGGKGKEEGEPDAPADPEPAPAAEPATPEKTEVELPETAAAPEAEVTQTDGATVIEAGDLTITISKDDAAAAPAAPAEPETTQEPETSTDNADADAASADPEASLESFFQNLNLANL